MDAVARQHNIDEITATISTTAASKHYGPEKRADADMRSTGILRYSPKLIGNHASEKWWLILDCDTNIVAYYRTLYKTHHHKTKELIKPAWDSHITIVRNEEPPNPTPWEKYAGQAFEFEYSHDIHTNGSYWWVHVTCQPLMDLRTELGLPAPQFPFHLSVGHE